MNRELKEKQNHLLKLSKGESEEQRSVVNTKINVHVHVNSICSEVRECEKRLDELESRAELKSLEEDNKENAQAIQSELYILIL